MTNTSSQVIRDSSAKSSNEVTKFTVRLLDKGNRTDGQSEPVTFGAAFFRGDKGFQDSSIRPMPGGPTGNLMSEETPTNRPVLNTYDDIDAALGWLRRYARSRAELCSLVVQYYAVDLDMLAYRLTA